MLNVSCEAEISLKAELDVEAQPRIPPPACWQLERSNHQAVQRRRFAKWYHNVETGVGAPAR